MHEKLQKYSNYTRNFPPIYIFFSTSYLSPYSKNYSIEKPLLFAKYVSYTQKIKRAIERPHAFFRLYYAILRYLFIYTSPLFFFSWIIARNRLLAKSRVCFLCVCVREKSGNENRNKQAQFFPLTCSEVNKLVKK